MSAERFTLDTNILVCCVDARQKHKQNTAVAILKAAVRLDCPLALQAIAEFYIVATSKLRFSAADARERSLLLLRSFETYSHSATALQAAFGAAENHRFSFWDAVLLGSAAEAGCAVVLSEDMADGGRFGSIAVLNPFSGAELSAGARELLAI